MLRSVPLIPSPLNGNVRNTRSSISHLYLDPLPAFESLRNDTPIVLRHRLHPRFHLPPLSLSTPSLLIPDIRPQHHARQQHEYEDSSENDGGDYECKLPAPEACGAEFDPGVRFGYSFCADFAGVESACIW